MIERRHRVSIFLGLKVQEFRPQLADLSQCNRRMLWKYKHLWNLDMGLDCRCIVQSFPCCYDFLKRKRAPIIGAVSKSIVIFLGHCWVTCPFAQGQEEIFNDFLDECWYQKSLRVLSVAEDLVGALVVVTLVFLVLFHRWGLLPPLRAVVL